MITEKMFVTQAIASQMLLAGLGNRPISRTNVLKYSDDMRAGAWRLTHQGLLLGKGGNIIDGAHRLTAISETGQGQWFLVSRDETLVDALSLPIDVGYKRSTAFILGISKSLAAVSTMAALMTSNRSAVSANEIELWVNQLSGAYSVLTADHKTAARSISSASVQLAGVVRILLGEDSRYICDTYSQLLLSKFTLLPPLPASFYRQVVIDRTHFDARQLFSRSMRMFDKSRQHLTKMQIKDESLAFEEGYELLRTVGPKSQPKLGF
jgi:hypothetical protein